MPALERVGMPLLVIPMKVGAGVYTPGVFSPTLGGQPNGVNGDAIEVALGTLSSAFDGSHTLFKLQAEEDCWLRIGENATAVARKCEPWAAGQSDTRIILAGQRISVVAA